MVLPALRHRGSAAVNNQRKRGVWPGTSVITHAANRNGRDFVAGDIHGHFGTVEHALAELAFRPDRDRLFSAGDLIDHGPRSVDALTWLASGRILAVRGNHEQMLVDTLVYENGHLRKSGHGSTWLECGGGWWWNLNDTHSEDTKPRTEAEQEARLNDWLGAMRQVPYLRRIDTAAGPVGIAHTMPVYYGDWSEVEEIMTDGAQRARQAAFPRIERAPSEVLWSRPDIEREDRSAPDLPRAMAHITFVVTGHTPHLEPRWTRENIVCIDTGVHIPEYGHLTIAEIQTGEPELHRFATR